MSDRNIYAKWTKNDTKANAQKPAGEEASTKGDPFAKAGATVGAVAGAVAGAVRSGTFIQNVIKYLFYLSVFAFVVFIVLLLIHYTTFPIFKFAPDDEGLLPIPTATADQKCAELAHIAPTAPCEFENPIPSRYTLFADVKLQNEFTTTGPRVLLYRGRTPVTVTNTDTPTTLLSLTDGKLKDSNFIAYMDAQKNDLYVAVKIAEGNGRFVGHSKPAIENVPIRKGFRLGFMLASTHLEVYLNGALRKTIPLTKEPVEITAEFKWYGPPRSEGVRVANIRYWDSPLTSKAIRLLSAGDINDKLFGTA